MSEDGLKKKSKVKGMVKEWHCLVNATKMMLMSMITILMMYMELMSMSMVMYMMMGMRK